MRVIPEKFPAFLVPFILLAAFLFGLWNMQKIFLVETAEAQTTRYEIPFSLRFDAQNTSFLRRLPTLQGSTTKMTLSMWVKRGKLGTTQFLYTAGSNATYFFQISFTSADRLQVETAGRNCANDTNITRADKITSAVFRDPSAWKHIVVAFDTTQATADNRNRVYVDGTEVTSFSTDQNITQNGQLCATLRLDPVGGLIVYNIGRDVVTAASYYDGLMADVILVDGAQLTPSSFGYTDSNGYWRPMEFVQTPSTNGPYGTNGIRFDFSNESFPGFNLATSSGKGLHFYARATSAADRLIDTPSHSFAAGNAAVPGDGIVSGGGLSNSATQTATMLMSTGKWYWEVTARATGVFAGVVDATTATGTFVRTAVTSTTTMGFRFDADAGTLASTTDGSNFIGEVSGLTGGRYPMACCGTVNASGKSLFIFGQGGTTTLTYDRAAGGYFRFTPPSGYLALSTMNMAEPTISQPRLFFDAKTYVGTGASNAISSFSFQPDFVWLKGTSTVADHGLFDAVRTATNVLSSNTTGAEVASSTSLTSFDSAGFTLGIGNTLNRSAGRYVSWAWKESATAGFDIVTYTGNGANRTISHSLGETPKFMVVKVRDSSCCSWVVYHSSVSSAEGKFMSFDNTNGPGTDLTVWNNSAPTASVFSVGTSAGTNGNASQYVAYLWSEVAGFSKFGTYGGNGAVDGPFIYTGFKPRFVLLKRTDQTGDWYMVDTARSTTTPASILYTQLLANTTAAQTHSDTIEVLANGFKLRNSTAAFNADTGTYVYAAFAEQPFKYSAANMSDLLANILTPSGKTTISYDLTIGGGLSIIYNLSKGSGTFAIDHPLDPKNKLLYHSFVESPDAKNIYDGIATLDENGEAWIELPRYFLALNKDFRYLATPIGAPMPNLFLKQEVRKRFWLFGRPILKISGGLAGGRVSWQVTGIRHDVFARENPIRVEVEKGPDELVEQGEFLHPDVYNPDGTKKKK